MGLMCRDVGDDVDVPQVLVSWMHFHPFRGCRARDYAPGRVYAAESASVLPWCGVPSVFPRGKAHDKKVMRACEVLMMATKSNSARGELLQHRRAGWSGRESTRNVWRAMNKRKRRPVTLCIRTINRPVDSGGRTRSPWQGTASGTPTTPTHGGGVSSARSSKAPCTHAHKDTPEDAMTDHQQGQLHEPRSLQQAQHQRRNGMRGAQAAASFLAGDAFFAGAAFLGAAVFFGAVAAVFFFAGAAAAFLVTRPDFVLPRTTGFFSTVSAWCGCD